MLFLASVRMVSAVYAVTSLGKIYSDFVNNILVKSVVVYVEVVIFFSSVANLYFN